MEFGPQSFSFLVGIRGRMDLWKVVVGGRSQHHRGNFKTYETECFVGVELLECFRNDGFSCEIDVNEACVMVARFLWAYSQERGSGKNFVCTIQLAQFEP